nr:hypothetical protein GCM10020092_097320 [Actinoplanes digitatis]
MTVTLPAGLRVPPGAVISAPPGWTVTVGPADGSVQTVTLTSDHVLRSTASESIDIPAKAMATGPWYVRAIVESTTYDRIPANNEYQLRLPVAARADLALSVDTTNAPRSQGGIRVAVGRAHQPRRRSGRRHGRDNRPARPESHSPHRRSRRRAGSSRSPPRPSS